MLLGNGASIDVGDDQVITPLGMAGLTGEIEVARLLLEKGASIEAMDAKGSTPLICGGHGATARPC